MKCSRCAGKLNFTQTRCTLCGQPVSLRRRAIVSTLCAGAGIGLGEGALVGSRIFLDSPIVALVTRVGYLLLVLAGLMIWRRRERRHSLEQMLHLRDVARMRLYADSTQPARDNDDAPAQAHQGERALAQAEAA